METLRDLLEKLLDAKGRAVRAEIDAGCCGGRGQRAAADALAHDLDVALDATITAIRRWQAAR